jgi:PAS domain S-box-containing protein
MAVGVRTAGGAGAWPCNGHSLIELIERAPEGIFIADLEGRFIEVNLAGCEMARHTRDEILGKTIVDFLRPEDVARLWARREQLLAGDSRCVEWVIRRGDGTELPIEATSVILSDGRWVGFLRDISPRRELEAQVAQRSAQLAAERNFVDTILDTAAALIIVRDEDARIVRFNQACEEVSGCAAAEMLGTTRWQELVPPEEQPGVVEMMDRLKAGEELVERENHWLRRDGARRLIRWRNKALRDDAGRVRFLVSVGTDVTDWYRAEAEARQHLEEASRLQRLQTANELATMLAHELNQPLAAITAYAEAAVQLVHQPSPDCQRVTMILERISRQALRAGEAIRQLRSFVGRERPKAVPLDLNAVVRDACGLAAPRARSAGVSLTLELDQGTPAVKGIAMFIEQVLLNLINNALDAIGSVGMVGGRITVTTQLVAGFAEVTVRDTGPGIDQETAALLFEPFFTRKTDGLGVGLPISLSLVEAQGGRLWVVPHVPGAIFHFQLPLAP